MKDLWQQYTHALHAKGIQPPYDRWYVIRTEAFLQDHKGKQLIDGMHSFARKGC